MFNKEELMFLWRCLEQSTIKGKDASTITKLFVKMDDQLSKMIKKEEKVKNG
jgi:hypothetical protein|tara:strand:+ start:370 stop:525 length:156 start_codon:yes stop_codon:yes gene_type:complete